LVVTEEIFSMDGDFGRVEEIAALCKKYGAWLLVDGAHSMYESAVSSEQSIYIGTLSKALGCYGGYVCGSKTLIEFIKTSVKTLIYSTALPPFVVGAALAALKLAPVKADALRENIALFGAASHIVPYIIGDEVKTLQAAAKLKQKGILVAAIRPPTVPPNSSRLRISLSAKHSAAEIEKIKTALNAL
jgi:8-amino-7-oxononanoate synthase